jgi:hypothetical protein
VLEACPERLLAMAALARDNAVTEKVELQVRVRRMSEF